MPVINGGIGVCHIFVDRSARTDLALPVLANAKIQRPSACNSMETALIHQEIAPRFIPELVKNLGAQGVTFHCDAATLKFFPPGVQVKTLAGDELDQEWLSLDMNIVSVRDLDEAIAHIHRHGSGHSEAILTEDQKQAEYFVRHVDAAAIYVNASTRFTDGGEFGLGAEVAISTQKTHARGPMGLEALTSCKWIGYGQYTVRK
jgi:glutamate-5-semialdehyde dehydrogenase